MMICEPLLALVSDKFAIPVYSIQKDERQNFKTISNQKTQLKNFSYSNRLFSQINTIFILSNELTFKYSE